VERCPGKEGEEWGCLAYFPRGWLNPLVTSVGGYTYVPQHTVEAENVKCDCTKLLGIFGRRTCRLTLIHRHVVTQVPPFEHWSTVIIKDETTRIQKEPPATECVRLVAPGRSCPPLSSLPPLGPPAKTEARRAIQKCWQKLRKLWAHGVCGPDAFGDDDWRSACMIACSMYPGASAHDCTDKWCRKGVCPPLSPVHLIEPRDAIPSPKPLVRYSGAGPGRRRTGPGRRRRWT